MRRGIKTHKGIGKWPYRALCSSVRKFHPLLRIRGWEGVDCKWCLKLKPEEKK